MPDVVQKICLIDYYFQHLQLQSWKSYIHFSKMWISIDSVARLSKFVIQWEKNPEKIKNSITFL